MLGYWQICVRLRIENSHHLRSSLHALGIRNLLSPQIHQEIKALTMLDDVSDDEVFELSAMVGGASHASAPTPVEVRTRRYNSLVRTSAHTHTSHAPPPHTHITRPHTSHPPPPTHRFLGMLFLT